MPKNESRQLDLAPLYAEWQEKVTAMIAGGTSYIDAVESMCMVARAAKVNAQLPDPNERMCVAFEVSDDGFLIYVCDDGSEHKSTIAVTEGELGVRYSIQPRRLG